MISLNIFKLVTTADDLIRVVAISMLAILLGLLFNLHGVAFKLLVGLAILIDLHELITNIAEGKPLS